MFRKTITLSSNVKIPIKMIFNVSKKRRVSNINFEIEIMYKKQTTSTYIYQFKVLKTLSKVTFSVFSTLSWIPKMSLKANLNCRDQRNLDRLSWKFRFENKDELLEQFTSQWPYTSNLSIFSLIPVKDDLIGIWKFYSLTIVKKSYVWSSCIYLVDVLNLKIR